MSRQERLKQYANPRSKANWQGAGRSQANLDRWSERAEANSEIAPRAKGGEMRLPDTDKPDLRDTAKSPKISRNAESAMKGDKNNVGSSFMPGVRRVIGG